MSVSIYPSANNIGNGKTMREASNGLLLQGLLGHKGQVDTGLVASAGSGRTVNVSAGSAVVKGRLVNVAAQMSLTVDADSAGRYLYLDVVLDASGNATEATLKQSVSNPVETSTSLPILLAHVTTTSTAITAIRDFRILSAWSTVPPIIHDGGPGTFALPPTIHDNGRLSFPTGHGGPFAIWRFRAHPRYRWAWIRIQRYTGGALAFMEAFRNSGAGRRTTASQNAIYTARIDLTKVPTDEPIALNAFVESLYDSPQFRGDIYISNDPMAFPFDTELVVS